MSTIAVNAITNAAGGNTATINGMTPTAQSLQGFRNRIINGDMRIDQRNNGAAVSTGGAFPVDRFRAFRSGGAATFTSQQSTVAPAGFTNSLLFTVGTGAAPGATDFSGVYQALEGFNVADLGWGTANAQSITLSFWVRSSVTGTFGLGIRNEVPDRSYVASFAIAAANTWEYKTITVPGDTTGTWRKDNGLGLSLFWDLGVGTTYSGAAGSWSGNNYFGLTGGVKLIATSGATFYITGVQLEAGSVATPFERRPYGTELALCQRYYEIAQGTETSICPSPSTGGYVATNSIRYAAVKRAAGTVTLNGVAGSNCSSITVGSSNVGGFVIYNQAIGAGNSQATYNWNTSAEL